MLLMQHQTTTMDFIIIIIHLLINFNRLILVELLIQLSIIQD